MRFEGWERNLDDYIQCMAYKSFNWGVCDCLIFVSDSCLITCGKDPMSYRGETVRGCYSSRSEAENLIKQHRGSMMEIMDFHFERIKVGFAQRGDVILAELDNGPTFGLVWGGKVFFKTETDGYSVQPLSACKCAWRVE